MLDLVVGRRQIEDGLIEQTVITIWDGHAELSAWPLRGGDKVVAVVDSTSTSSVKDALHDGTDGVEAQVASRQLELGTADDAYLPHGSFSAASTIGYRDRLVGPAIRDDGCRFARVLGEMSWGCAAAATNSFATRPS